MISLPLRASLLGLAVLFTLPACTTQGFPQHRKPYPFLFSVCLSHPFLSGARHTAQQKLIKKLAGPFAVQIRQAAHLANIPTVLVAAVANVENGGNYYGAVNRVSSAGAIGVMQLEPGTAWGFLHVNPWIPSQNIMGGARYLAYLLHLFHDNARLAVMAYNAGPNAIESGYRPQQSVWYAKQVLRLAYPV